MSFEIINFYYFGMKLLNTLNILEFWCDSLYTCAKKANFTINMDTKRQQKFSRLILKELSSIFQVDSRHLFGNAFITVTNVEISPDLSVAKIRLSFMLVADKNAMLESIREKSKNIRQILGNKIRNQARIIPELVFFLDDTADYAIKMNAILAELNIPKE